ncbi:MAG: hypothetical protein EO766_17250 [Hydrotalea sp. AMD]|uniref:hypothetical protein n=1 Tax=Hydrotalea sp. AMD TaxID=2501297 RepID=UPI0010273109|nr:hypothetical protein [Hydrotalea sp. AMD]RWZ84366.1 MAG: hypothetical protein EO766_17250 [Hydrotalea sp. AMD]
MKKTLKFKIDDKDEVYAFVQYKNGIVLWRLHFISNVTYNWLLVEGPAHYNPTRVKKSQAQFMKGKVFKNKLIRYAAASHNWFMLDRLKKAFDYDTKSYKN